MPPIFKIGKIAIAITIIPMPPNHWSIALQIKIDFDVESRFWITVAPVVVNPDIDSKNASINVRLVVPR